MEQFDKVKGFFRNMSSGLKKKLLIGGGALIAFAVILALVLNSGNEPSYIPLFSGLNETEASEVMAKLQETGVDYQYSNDGRVLVPQKDADRTRATLAVEGYPKSGFTYDTFLSNSNMMSTEADKKSLKTWDMQERLAATIRLIDGVQNAVVQIAPGETQKYVLDNSKANIPTASVMVTMKDGSSPSPEVVEGIQRLVAKAVENMDMGDVAVIDSNGLDVSIKKNDTSSSVSSERLKFEQKTQLELEANVLNILEPMYGRNNVRVSVRCTADMQKTISEESDYTAPNVQDNSGYITHQELTAESGGSNGAAGVPGADTNANVPQYNTQSGGDNSYTGNTSSTDYVLNQKKVQSQDDGGRITDVSIAVSINQAELGVEEGKLISIIGRAAGIDPAIQTQKIEVVNTLWPTTTLTDGNNGSQTTGGGRVTGNYPPYLPYIIGGGILLLLLIVVLLVRGILKMRKKARAELEREMMEVPVAVPADEEAHADKDVTEIPTEAESEAIRAIKENIRGFAESNPEISAQLLKNWIRGGGDND